ncbi:unnamed protein product [Lampetra fluviatilis]
MRHLGKLWRSATGLLLLQPPASGGVQATASVRCKTQSASFGLLFDIDGVLVRGRTPIPAARDAFRKLLDASGALRVPVVFVTNAGNCLRQAKAAQLSDVLGVPISQEQVMLSHSPLRMFEQYHHKHVLVSGQGPVEDIAKNLGFTQIVTIDMLREAFPLLDMVDQSRRPKELPTTTPDFPKIDAIILFGEPIRWETNLQLVMDVLLTDGRPGTGAHAVPHPHLPLLACNMDLMWMAEAKMPRFGHGTFMVCLESIYKKVTGRELKYEALIGKPSEVTYQYAEYLVRTQAREMGWQHPVETLYAIGDNPMADIYGANLYSRHLQRSLREERGDRQAVSARVQARAAGGLAVARPARSGGGGRDVDDDGTARTTRGHAMHGAGELAGATALACRSILVCTGVYSPHAQVPEDPAEAVKETVFHGHRDFRFDPELVEPTYTVEDVDAAVDLVFREENFTLA